MSDPNIDIRKDDLKAQIKSIKNRIDSDYLRLLEISQINANKELNSNDSLQCTSTMDSAEILLSIIHEFKLNALLKYSNVTSDIEELRRLDSH